MLKKLLILPLMAFALVTLTAATVSEDGQDIFEWEILEEDASLPSETETEFNEISASQDYHTYVFDKKDHLDVYISQNAGAAAYLSYNYNNKYKDYSSDNVIDLGVSFNDDLDNYIHIEITNYDQNDISVIGGFPDMEGEEPDISTLKTYSMPLPSIMEEIGDELSTIVTVGSTVFVSTFDGLWDVFWDSDANDGDGALNWIAYVAVLPVGFFLVRWGFRKILGMIQQRL